MSYLTLAIQTEHKQIANSIAICFEPNYIDPNEYDAFSVPCIDSNGTDYVAYGSDVNQFIYDNFEVWKDSPELFHGVVVTSYSEKYPDLTPPSLENCQIFCSNVLISKEYGVLSGIYSMELEWVKPEELE